MKRLLTAAAVVVLVALTGASTSATAAAATSPAAGSAAARPLIRVDQVGYATSEAKRAYLLAAHPMPSTAFTVRDPSGRAILTGRVGATAGPWTAGYGAVHPIDFTAVGVPGTYTVEAGGAVSPKFRIAFGWDLFGPLAADAVSFFTVQRDGADVVRGPLNR